MPFLDRLQLLCLTLLALVSPSRIADWAVDNERTTLCEDKENYRTERRLAAETLRNSVFWSLAKALGWSAAGFLFACALLSFFGISAVGVRLFQAGSVVLIAWAVLGRVGWEIQTMEGKTVIERINTFWFRFLYTCALLFGTTSLFLGILV